MDRPVPWSPPALHRQARQGVQADARLGRVLARRLRQRDAPAGLRHRMGEREAARGLPAPARGGGAARPPPARARDGPVPLPGRVAGGGVLAPEGPAALPGAHPLRARAPERGRLRRGRHPGDHGPPPVGSVRPLGGVPREHVHLRDRGRPGLRAQTDELPGTRTDLQERPGEEPPQPADAHRRVRQGAPLRAVRGTARADAGARVHPGRRARLLHRRPDHAGSDGDVRPHPVDLPRLRVRGRADQVRGPPRDAGGSRRDLGQGGGRAPGGDRLDRPRIHPQPRRGRVLRAEAGVRAARRDRPGLAVRHRAGGLQPAGAGSGRPTSARTASATCR